MKISEFLRTKTQVGELCVIRRDGWIIESFWIDCEDLFCLYMHDKNSYLNVQSDEWGTIPITTEYGDRIEIPCHYIDC